MFALLIGWAPAGRTKTLTVAGVAVVLPGTEPQVSLLASACQSSARAVVSACLAIARSGPDDRAIAYSALVDTYLSPLAEAAPLTAQDGRHDAPATRVGLQNYEAAPSEISFDAEPSSWATAKLNVANQYLNIATLTTIPGDTSAALAAAAVAVDAWKTIGRPQSYAYARLVHAFALARNADADGRTAPALARAAYAEALGEFTALAPGFTATGAQNWLDDIHSYRRWIAPGLTQLSAGR